MEEKEIFKKDDFKSFGQMKNQQQDDIQIYSNNIYKQVEHVPLLIHKFEHVKGQDINTDDIKEFL